MQKLEDNQQEQLKVGIENRLQFIVTLAVFYSTLIYFFVSVDATAGKAAEALLEWSLPIGFYVAGYVLFQIFKNGLGQTTLAWINRFLIAAVACFVVPVVLLASIHLIQPQPKYVGWLFIISSVGMLVLPLIIMAIIGWIGAYQRTSNKLEPASKAG
jgi:hypothetical protein